MTSSQDLLKTRGIWRINSFRFSRSFTAIVGNFNPCAEKDISKGDIFKGDISKGDIFLKEHILRKDSSSRKYLKTIKFCRKFPLGIVSLNVAFGRAYSASSKIWLGLYFFDQNLDVTFLWSDKMNAIAQIHSWRHLVAKLA